MNRTNNLRAARFDRILAAYDTGDSARETLIDLLADARHWCDRDGLAFAGIDRIAYRHYLNELEEGHP